MTTSTPDIPLFKVFMAPPEEVDKPVQALLHSGYVTQGKKVQEFEDDLARFFGNVCAEERNSHARARAVALTGLTTPSSIEVHALSASPRASLACVQPRVLTLNSGTSGLHLALHLLYKADADWPGLVENVDEVLTCPLTCTATNWPILANRLRIKWVDADPQTCNMDLTDLERKLSPTTKVIMVVHWGGSPVDLTGVARVQEVCFQRFGFRPRVIEDCAHAIGAEQNGLKLGNHGNMCVFSLQAIKHLTSVDGGLLLCPSSSLYERGKLVRWFGIDRNKRSGAGDFRMEADIPEYGFKFHMNDVNAAVGLANLKHLPKILEKCRANAMYFNSHLIQLPGIMQLADLPDGTRSSWWLYTLRVPAQWRARFFAHMKQRSVMVSAVHQRNDVHSCVARFSTLLLQLNQLAEEVVCLPVGWWLKTADREAIVDAVKTFSATYQAEAHLPAELATVPRSTRPKCLITGGCGFIGHHVVEHFCKHTDYQVVVLDRLSYASKGYDRLRDTGYFHQLETYSYDLSNPMPPGLFYEMGALEIEVVLHIAAETHVDNSIDTPVPFVENNIKSTLNLLEFARRLPRLKNFIYFSTDEVYGSAAEGEAFKEGDPHKPSNPYSASKSAAEMICHSYYNTYGCAS